MNKIMNNDTDEEKLRDLLEESHTYGLNLSNTNVRPNRTLTYSRVFSVHNDGYVVIKGNSYDEIIDFLLSCEIIFELESTMFIESLYALHMIVINNITQKNIIYDLNCIKIPFAIKDLYDLRIRNFNKNIKNFDISIETCNVKNYINPTFNMLRFESKIDFPQFLLLHSNDPMFDISGLKIRNHKYDIADIGTYEHHGIIIYMISLLENVQGKDEIEYFIRNVYEFDIKYMFKSMNIRYLFKKISTRDIKIKQNEQTYIYISHIAF